ncbi:MAG TPA: flagellar hook-basal body protein [Phycisphaerae bacterium]|nr:flagellar hook-basal body protein [Phycisphaerae bacterium]HRY68837.1 flagellar hook-basal body protein [Phycisphaerae bacterium]HSA27502.1 flagellar hook-basal body protein [Phycisphaerae bacterium]
MVYGIYLSAGGLQANQYRMEVLANNLANADTVGFKHDLTVMRERRAEFREGAGDPDASQPSLSGMTGGSLVGPTIISFEDGAPDHTGRPLDVAIRRDGFFRVQSADGERYTRDGRFLLNQAGELVTAAGGHAVLDTAGQPITIPAAAASDVMIDGRGEVRSGRTKTAYGRIGVVDFDDKSLLRKGGGNLFESLGEAPRDIMASLMAGTLEKSTVDPIQSMVSMIEVTRAYQLNATMVGLADQTLGRAVNDIGRIS